MIGVTVLDEPVLEFGYSGRHIEQRAGVIEHGPADVEMAGRRTTIQIGLVAPADVLAEFPAYLERAGHGLPGKESRLRTLYPSFPGFAADCGFLCEMSCPMSARRPLSRERLKPVLEAESDAHKVERAVEICAAEVRTLVEATPVDVVIVVRPAGVPEGIANASQTGSNFRDLLKAALITTAQPIQVIRPNTWRDQGVEDPATTAWNLFTALYYKAGGKPWRLARERDAVTRCFVGVSFTASESSDQLFASVAQIFNERGDGVVVRGGLAERSQADRQPHLSRSDAGDLLRQALKRYRDEHRTSPAAVTVHKTSSFSDGFLSAAADERLDGCELVWLTESDNAFLVRGSKYHSPLRGTLMSLSTDEHVLYTHGSVPFYKTYPGLYVPHPIGVRPCVIERTIQEIAAELLALTKLNWNRARMDARAPITLLTASRVGEILRHVPLDVAPAPRYSHYM
jgi:hypothetical protein